MKLREIARLGIEIGANTWLRSRPFLLYYKPTARCDLRCAICNRHTQHAPRDEELSLEEAVEMLATFRRAGSVVLTLWGGEPTLRKDLPELLVEAKRLGFRTSMCTNGRSLRDKADNIVPQLDVLLCSLDGHGALHDELRCMPGLFERVVEGIEKAARHPTCDVKIWATVSRRNVDQIRPLAKLARELGVGIEYFPVSAIGDYNQDVLPEPRDLRAAFDEVRRLKADGYPIRNPDRAIDIMAAGEAFRCNFGRIAIHLDHRGQAYSCEDPEGTPLERWGPWRKLELPELYASRRYREARQDLASCNRCRLPCVLELSGSLPQALATMALQAPARRATSRG